MPVRDENSFVDPPSFKNFDGGASSRWPATREIESFWYPVWLSYPAGMLPGSLLLDAPSHHVTPKKQSRSLETMSFWCCSHRRSDSQTTLPWYGK